jgi:very-short-patch-repair endonuclease
LDAWLPVALLIAIAIVPLATFAFARRRRRPPPPTLVAPTARLTSYVEGETTRLLEAIDPHGAYIPRPRFLDKPEGLLYFLIKAALPTHEVFARTRLSDVLEVKAGPQGLDRLQAYRKIANHFVDFVICDKSMKIVAVVELDAAPVNENSRHDKLDQFKQECIEAAGIRYLRFGPREIPRYTRLRELLIG